MQPFQVTLESTKEFAKVWNYKGLAMPLDEVHCEFAKDWANIALKSFIEQMVKQAQVAKAKAAAEAAPLVTL